MAAKKKARGKKASAPMPKKKPKASTKIIQGLVPFSKTTTVGQRARMVRDGIVQGAGLDPKKDYTMSPSQSRPVRKAAKSRGAKKGGK